MTETSTGLPIVVEGSAGRLRLFAKILFGVAAVLAIGMAGLPEFAAEVEADGETELMLLGIAGCIGVGAWFWVRAGKRLVVLEADEAGVTVRSASQTIGPVRWDEIAAIEVKRSRGVQYLGFELYEPDRTMARFGTAQKWGAIAAPFLGMSPMVVPSSLIDEPVYRLRDRLNAVLQASRAEPA